MERPILVVEDDADDRQFILDALERLGLGSRVLFAEDGAEALERLAGPVPDLILLDLMLPKLSGLEVLERLRAGESTRRTPVVMFTSSRQPEDVRRAYDRGANSFVVKPTMPADFEAAVRSIGEYWLTLNVDERRAEGL